MHYDCSQLLYSRSAKRTDRFINLFFTEIYKIFQTFISLSVYAFLICIKGPRMHMSALFQLLLELFFSIHRKKSKVLLIISRKSKKFFNVIHFIMIWLNLQEFMTHSVFAYHVILRLKGISKYKNNSKERT